MKGILAVMLTIAMIFCACGSDVQTPRARTVTTVPGPADTALPRQIVFSVGLDADEILVKAANNFARKANSLARGSFTITVEAAFDPLERLKSGGEGIVFVEGAKAESLHPYFAAANERFRYSGYEGFSMTCNSSKVLRRLSDASGLHVFAAFYTGSNVFAGGGSLDEILAASSGGEQGSQNQSVVVLLSVGSGTNAAFDAQGVMSAEAYETSERLDALYSENKIVELDFAELSPEAIAGASPSQTDPDTPVLESDRIVVTRTFHSITPTWLVLSPSLYNSLPPSGRAAIDEASAYIAGDIDHTYLKLEQERLDALAEAGAEISVNFKATRNRILKARSARASASTPDEKAFRDLLDRI